MTERILNYYGKKRNKRYDKRFSHETDSPVLHSTVFRNAVSAVLQYDGYDNCRKISGSGSSGGGGRYGFHKFYDYRVLYGRVQWICHSRGPAVWSGRLPCTAKVCGQQCVAFHSFFRSDDCGSLRVLPPDSAADEHSCRYYGRCLSLHFCDISGYSGGLSV